MLGIGAKTARRTMAALGGIEMPEDKMDGDHVATVLIVKAIVYSIAAVLLACVIYNAHENIVVGRANVEMSQAGMEQFWDANAGRVIWKKVR